jgi:ATP-dependent DNA helicase RecQ
VIVPEAIDAQGAVDVLRRWVHAGSVDEQQITDSVLVRLKAAITGLDDGRSGSSDVAVLVRQVLRRADEQQAAMHHTTLPIRSGWPSAEMWVQHGIQLVRATEHGYLARAQPWQPAWLAGADAVAPEAAACAEVERRNFEPVFGDPFLALPPYQLGTYRCVGQREAVRAVLTAPPGATLLVNLPTGAGKSLCAHLPSVLRAQERGVTVVVVPTVALAIDQERSLQAAFPAQPLAYYGAATPEHRARNEEIRRRVRSGEQQILFTSPEGLIGPLSSALYRAAAEGLLRMLVIDEAHVVDEWGTDFRSSFQDLAGLRLDLLRTAVAQPFLTLLLSATVTSSTLRTLDVFFRHPGSFGEVSAVQLRPEPSYWFAYCETPEEKDARVMKALHHLPRPLILYTTRRADVQSWSERLSAADYRRFATMTGETEATEREDVMTRWRRREIDIMVATSAFGLGVDQADVRAVVHACVPESIDRYYQEVGRGGRDGRASVALMIHDARDLDDARRLNRQTIIGIKKGLERWKQMFRGATALGEDRYRVPIHVGRELDMEGERNDAWNVRTLTLMHRAGLIRLDGERPPQQEDLQDLGEEAVRQKLEEYSRHRVVAIRHPQHQDKSVWNDLVSNERARIHKETRTSLNGMHALRNGGRCASDVFADAYKIPSAEHSQLRQSIHVARACGGCPACRRQAQVPYAHEMPQPLPAWEEIDVPLHPSLQQLLSGARRLNITYAPGNWGRRPETEVVHLLQWFLQRGIRAVVASPPWLRALSRGLRGQRTSVFYYPAAGKAGDDSLTDPFFMPDLPHIIFVDEQEEVTEEHLNHYGRQPRILLFPEAAPDPRQPYRPLRLMVEGVTLSLNDLRTRIHL